MSNIENRDKLEQSLREELVGPSPQGEPIDCTQPLRFENWSASNGPWHQAANGEEILQRDRPTKRYGIGVLYPFQTEDDPVELVSCLLPDRDRTGWPDRYCPGLADLYGRWSSSGHPHRRHFE